MEEMAIEIPQSPRRDERHRQEKESEHCCSTMPANPQTKILTPYLATPGEGEDTFEKALQALKNYFTPRQNREHEIYVFRQAKKESNEAKATSSTRHLARPEESCRCRQSSDTINSIRITQSSGDDKLLFKVHP